MSDHTLPGAHGLPDIHEGSHGHGPQNPVRNYALTLGALLVLTAITVGVAQFDLGEANLLVAVVVATLKATLVALFFMHLLHDKPMNALIFCTALVMLSLLFLFSFTDSGTRDNLIPQSGQLPAGSDFNRPAQLGVPFGGEKKIEAAKPPAEPPR
jgi:cytochrome c oxidase subunit IV